MKKRVVITGMGTVNPLANTVKETWKKLLAGESGIDRITRFDPSRCASKIAGEVKNFHFKDYYSEKSLKTAKRMDDFVHYAAAATREAVEQSGLNIGKNPQSTGICLGSGLGGVKTQYDNSVALAENGPRRVSPSYIPAAIGNIAAGFLSMEYGIKGPNLSLQTACATANHALGVAFMLVQSGMAKVMIAGGAESAIEELVVIGFSNMRALSTRYNDSPQKASRPYDLDRDGFVIAEGAGVLLLEEYEHAVNRGAQILCEMLSLGVSGDAYDLVIPDPEGRGAFAAMDMACRQAEVDPAEINYINAHGTSTPLGDAAEAMAIKQLIKGKEDNLHVGSTKSMHGHLLGATAGLEAIISAMAIKEGRVPPNINLDSKDPKVELSCINREPLEKRVNLALSNSFGFGGHNSSILLGKVN